MINWTAIVILVSIIIGLAVIGVVIAWRGRDTEEKPDSISIDDSARLGAYDESMKEEAIDFLRQNPERAFSCQFLKKKFGHLLVLKLNYGHIPEARELFHEGETYFTYAETFDTRKREFVSQIVGGR